ncbi:MAG: hypothetical protein ACXU9W_03510 [Thermodesulfobacteriota bacterium]
MKKLFSAFSLTLVFSLLIIGNTAIAGTQDKFNLPEPYLSWEKSYLDEFPDLQKFLEAMITTTATQLQSPSEDILHNRVCSALAYEMSKALPSEKRKLAIATDILHNIAKEDKTAVLTDPKVFKKATEMVTELKKAGYFRSSPDFWGDAQVLLNTKVGANRALIHHITGGLTAAQIAKQIGGFSEKEIQEMQAAVIEHSTGYWYFRDSVDQAAGKKGAWHAVYPEPASEISKIAHDADLISQFAPESVVPDGSKWRMLAKKRWGAKNTREEGQIVYYVFLRLYEEGRTIKGKEMAREKWETIRPELMKLMNLEPNQDPIKVLGVPAVFQ